MTENARSPEERLKQLRGRTSAPAAKSKKSHAALGSRIATVGLGASAMLALVTTIDVANQPEAAATPVAAPTADRPVVVVVHQQPTSTPAIKSTTAAAPKNVPIQLTATPVVTTIYTTSPSGQASAPATTQTRAMPSTPAPTVAAPVVVAPPAPAPAPVVVAPAPPAQPAPAPVAQTNGS